MTTTRTYDNLNRLQTVSSVSSASSVVAFSYGYNDANQRARATLADGSVGHDDDGNLTQDGRWRYTWDAENRLVRIEPATAVGPQLTLTFTYDALSRRMRKTVTGAGSAVDQRLVVKENQPTILATAQALLPEPFSPSGGLVAPALPGQRPE